MAHVWRHRGRIGMGLPLYSVVFAASHLEAPSRPLMQEVADETQPLPLQDL